MGRIGGKLAVLSCSFCGKSQIEVLRLIAGPTVYICNECVTLCVDILAEPGVPGDTSNAWTLPSVEDLSVSADLCESRGLERVGALLRALSNRRMPESGS